MSKTRRLATLLGILLGGVAVASADQLAPLALVPALDPARYAGTWYEIARYQQGFEKSLVGVTAEYALRPDGRISVLNAGYKQSLDGAYSSIKAEAWQPDPSKPGALKVRFFGLFVSDYLVFALDQEGYSWALVGNDSRGFLWFLSRSPTVSPELWAKLKAIATSQGYDMSKLYVVPQRGP